MHFLSRFTVLGALFILCIAGPSEAQYMKITTDNPADPLRLRSSGATTLTLTLDTIHDRDGSLQSCNSHTSSAGCMPTASVEPLDLFEYTITLAAIGGTVTWGTFTSADPNYEILGEDLANNTQTEFSRFASSTTTPPGLITLGTIPVAVTSGAPEIRIAHGTQTIDPFGFGTGFGTHCDAFQYPNTYLLGDPAFVCATGDWFDVDGAAAPSQGTGGQCPVSVPGGIYNGLVGVPLTFDGTGSFDPDGDPLTYAWDFDATNGIQIDATGPKPSHTFAFGSYSVTLTVTDNESPTCSNTAATLAYIYNACDVTIFNGYEPIRVGSGRSWFAYVQPASACYGNSDVVLSSFIMSLANGGAPVYAETKKTTVGGDKSGDGIAEIRVSFSNESLQSLFGNRPSGTYLVIISAGLVNGGKISGVKYVQIVRNGGQSFAAASISPNPLNPEATLTYTTSKQGFVRIDMFDIQGRLARRLVDAPAMAAGTHEAKIDGRGEQGEKLPSGVYFIRGTSPEGTFKHLATILK